MINAKYCFLIACFFNGVNSADQNNAVVKNESLEISFDILNEPKKESFWRKCCCCVWKSTHNEEINILNKKLKEKDELIKYYKKREYDLEEIIGKKNFTNNQVNKYFIYNNKFNNQVNILEMFNLGYINN